jgi:hypothetical protein
VAKGRTSDSLKFKTPKEENLRMSITDTKTPKLLVSFLIQVSSTPSCDKREREGHC